MKTCPVLTRDVRNAYSDCNGTKCERNLGFLANDYCSVSDAVKIMKRALPEGGYNDFEPEILANLPANCQVILARENSVCVYVISPVTLDEKTLKKTMRANEVNLKSIDFDGQNISAYRLWWD